MWTSHIFFICRMICICILLLWRFWLERNPSICSPYGAVSAIEIKNDFPILHNLLSNMKESLQVYLYSDSQNPLLNQTSNFLFICSCLNYPNSWDSTTTHVTADDPCPSWHTSRIVSTHFRQSPSLSVMSFPHFFLVSCHTHTSISCLLVINLFLNLRMELNKILSPSPQFLCFNYWFKSALIK